MKQQINIVSGLFIHEQKLGLVRNVKAHRTDPSVPIRLEPTGGKIEPGETEEQAILREAQEELQRTCTIVRKLCTATTQSNEGEFEAHMYHIELDGDMATLTTHEPSKLDGIVWLDKMQLQEWCVNPPTGMMIVPNVCSQLKHILPLLKHDR